MPKKESSRDYSSCIGLTQQFRFCPNPFRVDLYKGCTFGCTYCFANSSLAKGHEGFGEANLERLEKLFHKAFETDDTTGGLTVELLRHRVPLHCGGMSDPFQHREWKLHLTYRFIELTNKYNYPVCFSSKTAYLPDEYYEILNPDIHAFQTSILGWDDEFIKRYETNTPTSKERLEFGKKLREKGFWWCIRIQPLINLDQALLLLENAKDTPNYVIVEHLKIPQDNEKVKALFSDEYQNGRFTKSKNNYRNIEEAHYIKESNILAIKEVANKYGAKVGVGDNDLHYLSQSRCCCGIDTINDNFSNYLKYNLTYFVTGTKEEISDIDELWAPKSNCKQCFFSSALSVDPRRFIDFKEQTREYIYKNTDCIGEEHREVLCKKLFGVAQKKLF